MYKLISTLKILYNLRLKWSASLSFFLSCAWLIVCGALLLKIKMKYFRNCSRVGFSSSPLPRCRFRTAVRNVSLAPGRASSRGNLPAASSVLSALTENSASIKVLYLIYSLQLQFFIINPNRYTHKCWWWVLLCDYYNNLKQIIYSLVFCYYAYAQINDIKYV